MELIITLVFLSIFLGATSMIYNSMFKPYFSQEKRTGIKADMVKSLPTFSQELRQATAVNSAQAASISFNADLDGDGVDETIQYSWSGISGAPLQRIADVTIPTVQSVSSLTFSYFDADNNLLSIPVTVSQVRVVALNLTGISQDETFQLRSQTRLRNLS